MYRPKVTIITVVYNAVDTIERTIKSVINQDYKKIEYIIVDGQSTDGTSNIIKKYRQFLARYICEPDAGIYDAMNKGIRHATGDIISILNADDWLYSNSSVTRIVEKYNEDKNIEIVSGQIAFVRNGELLGHTHYDNFELIWDEMPVAHPATFVKKSVYDKLGTFDTAYKIAADYDFIFRCYINHVRIAYLADLIVNFSVNGVSGTEKRLLFEEDNAILHKYKEYSVKPYDMERAIEEKEKLLFFYESAGEELESILPDEFYIWGCGYWGKEICSVLAEKGIEIKGFIDNNSNNWNKRVLGKMVYAPKNIISSVNWILIAVKGKESEVASQIKRENASVNILKMNDLFDEIYDMKKKVRI